MRRLRIAVCLAFVLACVMFGGYTVKSKVMGDHKAPVITCDEDTVTISASAEAEEQKEALMKGVTAKDNRDGDLTKSVCIASMSHFKSQGKRTVTYVVFDKANHVGTLERTVMYTDYVSPRIYLKKPLRFSLDEINKVSITRDMIASDCLDGDLTGQIHTVLGDNFNSYQAGTYGLTVQVNNSAGDVCAVPLEATIVDSTDRQERSREYPVLSEYIVYTSVGQAIDPMVYLSGIERNGTVYTYAEDGEYLAGTQERIGVTSNVDYATPGTYVVEFTYTADGASTAVTRMYIVVEEQRGE